jgi:hypothetical protein
VSETLQPVQTTTANAPQHETHNMQLYPVVFFGSVLIVITVLVLVIIGVLFRSFAVRRAQLQAPPSPLAQAGPQLPPEPRLQVKPWQDLQQLRSTEDAVLHSYGWVKQEEEMVRIPIERAMQLLAERGLPTRPAVPSADKGR